MAMLSTYLQIGDPKGKVVEGRIFHVVGDDIYVDMGGKFPAVCRRPNTDEQTARWVLSVVHECVKLSAQIRWY